MIDVASQTAPITTWQEFAKQVRRQKRDLLHRLDEFPESILITGCQRSGTTMLSRVLTESEGLTNYWFGPDDELDAALILSGQINHTPQGRYCFQTTFVNERYREYAHHSNGHRVIWVLRNPFSVVYSMLYNWKRFALDELFAACGAQYLSGIEQSLYKLLGLKMISPLRRACFAYQGKVLQLFELKKILGPDRLLVIDYDELVARKEQMLPTIYQFINLAYDPAYAAKIHAKSLRKADDLATEEVAAIQSICIPVYEAARTLLSEL